MTQQRRVIYKVICDSPRHLSAEEIFQKARAQLPSIAMGTVYRNLNLMVEAGDILRIEIAGHADRFDKTIDPHHHCICPECKEVSDVAVPDLTKMLARAVGRPIASYELTLRILCKNCATKKE